MYFSSDLHDSAALKDIAMTKLRNNREILRDSTFMDKITKDIMADLFREFLQ